MKIAFNPSTVAALTTPPNNKDITFDLRGRNIFARGVKFYGTDTNTWRDIKVNNVSIGSHTLDLRNGSNTTLTNTNGVVTINSTWRPVVDNLTSNSTTSSLSANQGRVLKALIDGKSDSGHNHDGRYLKLSGGTMTSDALIRFADSGTQGARGGLYWTGQSDYAKLYAEETAGNNLDLVIQFGDDNSNGLSIRNKSNVQTSYISAGGVITTGTFKGNLDWSYITNKPATATRWPSWAEVTGKPSSFTPSTHTHGLSNSVFFLSMPSISGNAKWKEIFGYPVNYNLLLSVRINSPAPEWCVGNYGSGILYGGSDTKGFMSSAYNEPLIMWAGGNGSSDDSVPKWYIGIRGTHKSIYNLTTIASEANAAYNLRHSHANKSVLDGITSGLVSNWNTAYTFVHTITGTDTDNVINKWDEIVNFLAGITEDNKLNTLLNSKLSIQQLSAKDILTTKTNNALFWVNTVGTASSITTGPFTDHPYALLSVTNYSQNDTNGKFFYRSRLAFSSAGDIKVASCHHQGEYKQDDAWYNVLTSKNSGISGSTIKLNGTSITVYSSGTADGRYVKKSGDTMSGALNFANNTWNQVGDDVAIGDHNVAGCLGIKGLNASPGLAFYNSSNTLLSKLVGTANQLQRVSEGKTYTIIDTASPYITHGVYVFGRSEIGNSPNYDNPQKNGLFEIRSSSEVTGETGTKPFNGWGAFLNLKTPDNIAMLQIVGSTESLYYRANQAGNITMAGVSWKKVLDTGNSYVRDGKGVINGSTITLVDKATNATNSTNARKLVNWYSSRPTSLNAQFGDGSLRIFYATSSTTEGKPAEDSHILHLAWDNTGGWDAQLAVHTRSGKVSTRAQNGGTWQPWKTLAFTTDIPTSLKNPHALTISLNGTSQGPYDGSATKNINITPGSIGAATSVHTHDYLVVNTADDKSFNSAYHNFQVLYAGGSNEITGKPANVDAFGLFRFRTAFGWSGQMLLANGGSLYIRSSEDAKMTNTLAWKTILDSSNYSGILDSRYYTESEVNSLLSNKLNTSNFNWTNLPGKIVIGNEFNIVNAGFKEGMWFNYLPINDRSKTATISSYHFGNGAKGYTSIIASGFIKSGGNASQLLRADGGVAAFNWSGQSGQPTWLWGGNSQHSYYVYNPSNFRVAYAASAGNADTLDGEHANSFVRAGAIDTDKTDLNALDTYSFIKSVNSEVADHSPKRNTGWYNVIQLVHRNGSGDGPGYIGQIALGMTSNTDDMFFRGKRTDSWKTVIHSGNISSQTVASATKLQTARKIWGQSFDGTADVSGTLSNAGHINFLANNTYDVGSNTSAIRYIYTYWIGAKSGQKLELGANNSAYGKGLCLDTNLNVGIGTNTPSYKLDVKGDIYSSGYARASSGFIKDSSSNAYVLLGGGSHKLESALNVAHANISSSADKLTTVRNIALGTDLRGSANFDGSSNIIINANINACTIGVGSTNGLPFKRIAHFETGSSWNDNALLLYISQGYINGSNGICRVEFRTDNISSSNSNPSASSSVRWLVRNGYNLDSLYAGYYVTTGKAYIDIYLKTTGSYQGTVIRVLQDSRGGINSNVQLINSYYYSDTNHKEAYNSVEAASTALYNRAYTRIVSGSDVGTVSHANSAGSVNWNNITGKPSSLPANGGNADTVDGVHMDWSTNYTEGNYLAIWDNKGNCIRPIPKGSTSVGYASSAGNASTLGGTSLGGLFTAFGNNAHNITATIGGVTKSFLVNWAADSDKLDGKHASDFATVGHNHDSRYVKIWGNVEANFNFPDGEGHSGVYMCHTTKTQSNKPETYGLLTDFSTVNGHLQFFGASSNKIYTRTYWWTGQDNFKYTDWHTLLHTGNSSVSGHTITINGTSTTWSNSWRPIGTGASDAAAGNHTHKVKINGSEKTIAATGVTDLGTYLTSQSLRGYVHAYNNTGTGNAVTSISIEGGTITANKGTTFLTSHQSLANYYTKGQVDAKLGKYLPLAGGTMDAGAQIQRTATGGMWYQGRSIALLRETSANGYHALWSLKTTDGSWDFGEYNSSDWNNIPVLSYVLDSNFDKGSNITTYQIKFPLASGTIALTSNILNPTNYYWANVKISASSNSETSPTFNTAYATNYQAMYGSTSVSAAKLESANTLVYGTNTSSQSINTYLRGTNVTLQVKKGTSTNYNALQLTSDRINCNNYCDMKYGAAVSGGNLTVNNNTYLAQKVGAKVGIGTDNPEVTLDVGGPSKFQDTATFYDSINANLDISLDGVFYIRSNNKWWTQPIIYCIAYISDGTIMKQSNEFFAGIQQTGPIITLVTGYDISTDFTILVLPIAGVYQVFSVQQKTYSVSFKYEDDGDESPQVHRDFKIIVFKD